MLAMKSFFPIIPWDVQELMWDSKFVEFKRVELLIFTPFRSEVQQAYNVIRICYVARLSLTSDGFANPGEEEKDPHYPCEMGVLMAVIPHLDG